MQTPAALAQRMHSSNAICTSLLRMHHATAAFSIKNGAHPSAMRISRYKDYS